MNVAEEARQSYEKIQKNLSSQLEELYATLLRAYETDFGLLVEQNSCVQTFQDYNKFLSEREETYTREEFLFPAADDSENYQKQIAALTFAKNALNLKNLEADLLNSVKDRKAKALKSYHSLCDMALTIAPQKYDPQKAAALLAAVPSLNNETNCTTLLTHGGDLIEEAPLSKIEEVKKTMAKSGVVSFYTFPPQKRPNAAPTIQRHKNNCDSSKAFYKKSASEKVLLLKKWQTAAVIFLPLLAFILSMIFLPFEAIAARMFPSMLIACACFSVCSLIFNRLAKGTYQKTLKAIDAIYAGFDSFCEQTEKQIVNKFYNDYAAALKRHKTQENYLDQLAFYEQELTELSALHEKNVLLCSEKTAFLPAQFDPLIYKGQSWIRHYAAQRYIGNTRFVKRAEDPFQKPAFLRAVTAIVDQDFPASLGFHKFPGLCLCPFPEDHFRRCVIFKILHPVLPPASAVYPISI